MTLLVRYQTKNWNDDSRERIEGHYRCMVTKSGRLLAVQTYPATHCSSIHCASPTGRRYLRDAEGPKMLLRVSGYARLSPKALYPPGTGLPYRGGMVEIRTSVPARPA